MNAKPLLVLLVGIVGLQTGAIIALFLDREARNPLPAVPISNSDRVGASAPTASFAPPLLERPAQSPVPAQSSFAGVTSRGQASVLAQPPSGNQVQSVSQSRAGLISSTVGSVVPVPSGGNGASGSGPVSAGGPASSAPQSFNGSGVGQEISSGRSGASVQPATVQGTSSTDTEQSLLIPAALAPQDETIPITTDQQVTEWENLREDFIAAVGGEEQNLSDPASRSRWIQAQSDSDDNFRAKFGWQAFLQQNLEAGRLINGSVGE